MIKLKTKVKVDNVDIVNSESKYIYALMTSYDSLTHSGEVRYFWEEPLDTSGISVIEHDIHISNFDMSVTDIDNLFNMLGLGITPGQGYHSQNILIMTEAIKYYIGSKNMFGLTSSDWEVVPTEDIDGESPMLG